MPNVLLTRIDNRLVHGQVGNVWATKVGCNLIVVADDQAANDPIQQTLMKATADSVGCGIRFFSIQKTIDIIGKASEKQLIFIVCKTPESARRLAEGGVPIKELCIGNMHASEGKRVSNDSHVYVDDKDLEDLRAVRNLGFDVYIQIQPGDSKKDFEIK